ncbi:MAG: bifunctional pyr operon transcriptional regulator/uracil phosphoribosyltransferase PyrR [Bacteroidota bacterium]
MSSGRVILNEQKFGFTLQRMCQQLIENYHDFTDTVIVGIQDRGALLSDRIVGMLESQTKSKLTYGKLDISFHRDDYRRRDDVIAPSPTTIDFIVENKNVILIDDVLYTGRSVHAAMSALQQFGRPGRIELLVFVNRRFNRHFPIKADYQGMSVDAIDDAFVKVEWEHLNGKDQILFFEHREKKST